MQHARFNRSKRNFFWLEHHLLWNKNKGRCKWENCLGLDRVLTDRGKKIKKPHDTRYRCIQCTLQFETTTHFFNEYGRNGSICNCHDLYHKNTMGRRLTTTMVTILIASTSNYVIPSVLCVFYYHPSCLLLSLSLSLLLFMFFFVLYLRAIGWRFFSLPRNTNAYGTM